MVKDRPKPFGQQATAITWSDLNKAQEFCENMIHSWEQVMVSLEFADRLE